MYIDIFLKDYGKTRYEVSKKQGYQDKFYQKPTIESQKLTV
ncbi:hypothetical protein [Enterococcus faecalis]|nr:hypothetical protein [Enterococcus faecalis]